MKTYIETRQRSLRCRHCGGNAYLETIDEPELRCLQCGRLVARLASNSPAAATRLPAAA